MRSNLASREWLGDGVILRSSATKNLLCDVDLPE
jgi:hypothetical protein